MLLQGLLIAQLLAEVVRYEVMIFLWVAVVGFVLLSAWLIKLRRDERKKSRELENVLVEKEATVSAIMQAYEHERQTLSEQLNADFEQLISVLKLNLSPLNKSGSLDLEKQREIFKNSESVLNEMHTDLKAVCFQLRPTMFLKRGLTPTLKEFGTIIEKAEKVDCKVLVQDNIQRLSSAQELTLFRITQLWVKQVLQKSMPDNIRIQLNRSSQLIQLNIEDDGAALDHDTTDERWKLIEVYLAAINGSFSVERLSEEKRNRASVKLMLV